jgi:hypothetical protein
MSNIDEILEKAINEGNGNSFRTYAILLDQLLEKHIEKMVKNLRSE